jgi:MFS family permease
MRHPSIPPESAHEFRPPADTVAPARQLGSFAPALFLLALCLLIDYIDRSNLSLAAPLLKDELHISATQLGMLLSAFFWTYTVLQFVTGLWTGLPSTGYLQPGFCCGRWLP